MKISLPAVRTAAQEFLQFENIPCDEVIINFVSTKKISQLHEEFFQDPTTTDCISFPLDDEPDETGHYVLGEIFVCPQTAIDYSLKHKTNPYDECLLYMIHGLLHLIGFDDLDPSDRRKMRRKEQIHMKNLQSKALTIIPKYTERDSIFAFSKSKSKF